MDYRVFHGYTIYEDGTITGLYNKNVKPRIKDNRYDVRLVVNGKRRNYILSRLIYWLFVNFDYENKNLCVSYKDGNSLNIHYTNLYLTERKNLIQGEGHRKRIKITDEQIEEIKAAYKGNKMYSNQYTKTGLSLNDLAKKYGVTKGEIQMIIKGWSRNPSEYKLK